MDQSKEPQNFVESDEPNSSATKDLLKLFGLTAGCVLAAWLVIAVWDKLF
jgi:hypothetical protein